MIRAAFLTIGLYISLCGMGLFVVDEVTLTERMSASPSLLLTLVTDVTTSGLRTFHPPEWMPFTCVGVGGVTMLYAIALPRRA